MANNEKSTTDQILDLLLDALAERQAKRPAQDNNLLDVEPSKNVEPQAEVQEVAESDDALVADSLEEQEPNDAAHPIPHQWRPIYPLKEEEERDEEGDDEIPAIIPEKLPSIHLEKMLYQLSLAVFLIIIVINVPFNRFGTNLARAMPDEQAIVVRNGLVIKGSGDEIYVLENNKKRWISSLDAFDYFGYRWEQVNLVDDDFLAQFEDGRPIHVLLKCNNSPHIYVLEDGKKRWINTITTFQIEGFVWEDVKFISCTELRRIPDGLPIPVDAGEPPQP